MWLTAIRLTAIKLVPMLFFLAFSACSEAGPDLTQGTSTTGPGPQPTPSLTAVAEPVGFGDGLGGGERPALPRWVRRMPIDTLQASMTKVAGSDVNDTPIEWKVGAANGFSDAAGAFGKALGRPDYRVSTDENELSTALYMKIVGDAARDICFQMAKNDMARSDVTARALFPKVAADGSASEAEETANLQYLLVRFIGLSVPATDSMITVLRAVYQAGKDTAVPGAVLSASAEGWRGVCVTLFESPLFHNN
ncbi:MAG: hypothetical protein EXR75_03255 [Myxococcales bacterium]|nr:hypothetical protein [Myxococcales bacterium]